MPIFAGSDHHHLLVYNPFGDAWGTPTEGGLWVRSSKVCFLIGLVIVQCGVTGGQS